MAKRRLLRRIETGEATAKAARASSIQPVAFISSKRWSACAIQRPVPPHCRRVGSDHRPIAFGPARVGTAFHRELRGRGGKQRRLLPDRPSLQGPAQELVLRRPLPTESGDFLRYGQRLANGIQSLAEPTCRQLNLGVGDLSVLDAETQVRRLCARDGLHPARA